MIVETGFYIYFLISYYSELDMQEIDQGIEFLFINRNIK